MNNLLQPKGQVVLAAVFLIAFAVLPALLSSFLLFQVSLALTYAMAGLGLNLLLGFSGQVCLAQGAFFACGAYTTAILNTRYSIDPLLTLPVSTFVTGLVGVAIGLPALRLPGLQLAIVTFGIAAIVPQLILKLSDFTGGATGLSMDVPIPPAWFFGNQETWLYYLCAAAAGLCVVVMLRLVRGDTGRMLRALRDNALIAQSLGIDLTHARLAVFAISSGVAGLGGGLYAILNGYISPQSFLASKSIDILVGTIIGGASSISGAFIGAVFVVFVPDWASEFNPALGALIYGLCLIGMMLLAREGVVGLVKTGVRHLAAKGALQQSMQRSPSLDGSLRRGQISMKRASLTKHLHLAILLLTYLWSSAAVAAEDTGITDTTVKIGVTGAMTGPVAALGAIVEGIKVKIAAVNAAGGVKMGDGKTRKIELVVQDDALDPQRTLTNVRKMVEKEEVFSLVGTAGTPNNQAIGRYLDQRGVPNLFMYSGVHEMPSGGAWMIGLVPSFTTEAAAFAEYVKKTKPDAKIALLYLNTETGQSFQASLVAAIKGSSVQIVAAQPVTAADPTIDTQLSNLKASGADTLVVITAPKQGAQAVKFAAESGWHPTTLVSYIASSVASLKPAGLSNAKGIITSQFVKQIDAPASAEDAGVQQYLADLRAVQPPFEADNSMGQIGYLTGDALVRVLEMMKEPSRQAMIEATRIMNNVQLGLLLPGIALTTSGDGDIYPIESLQLFQFDGERYQPVGDIVSYEGQTPRI